MVNAMAPNAPMGAASMMIADHARTTSGRSCRRHPRCAFTPGMAASARPNRIATNSTCRISPCVKALVTVAGMMFSRKSTACSCCALRGVLRDRLGVQRGGIDIHPRARLYDLDHHQPDEQRDGGDHLEIRQRFEADAAQLLHVADAGDAHDHREEDDGRDHHPDQLNEAIAQRLHRFGSVREEQAQQHAQNDPQDDAKIERFIEPLWREPRAAVT